MTNVEPAASSRSSSGIHGVQGALLGLIVAFVEMHSAYVTTGRFDLSALIALTIYYTLIFSVFGLLVGLAAALWPRRSAGSSNASLPPVLAAGLAALLVVRCGADGLYSVFRGDAGGARFLALAVGLPALAAGCALFLAGRSPWLGRTRGIEGLLVASFSSVGALFYASVVWRWSTASEDRGLVHLGLLLLACFLSPCLALALFNRSPVRIRGLVLGACLLALIAARAFVGPAEPSRILETATPDRAPLAGTNVLLVVLDTLRADHMDLYGYQRQTMPRLTEFAQRAEVYEDAVSSSSWTLPSHASLFTGRSPREHGARGALASSDQPGRRGSRALDQSVPTLAETLRAAGYRTEGVVANSLYLVPKYGLHRGFDYWDARPSFQGATNEGYSPLLFQMRSAIDATPLRWLYEPLVAMDIAQLVYRRAPDINATVRRRLQSLRDDDRPFFLFVNYMDPHDPYLAPGRFADRFPGRLEGQPRFWQGLSYRQSEFELETLRRHLVSQYDSVLSYLDHHLGELLRWLEANEVFQDTIVVITSDHGEAFLEHGQYQHGKSLYQEEISVPLIIRYPADRMQPRRVSEPVELTAVMPWLLHQLGVAPPPGLEPVERLENARPIVAELAGVRGLGYLVGADVHHDVTMYREGPLKYLESSAGPALLYDLRSDPSERKPLPKSAPAWDDLAAKLAQWLRSTKVAGADVEVFLSPEEIERLRSLGYIE
jgi:arylsulfatase A-like enzyme